MGQLRQNAAGRDRPRRKSYRVVRPFFSVKRWLVAADEEDDEENGQWNTEQPEKPVAADATGLIGEFFKRFHAV